MESLRIRPNVVTCGNLVKALAIFDDTPKISLIIWTAMIGGYGLHGQGEIALDLFDEMISSGVQPDRTVYVSVTFYLRLVMQA
uniref:Pentatricopeptide repeat-containing protein n=1 Tax=Chenopodium quinoa TaxID=63459 RepID=A0A803L2V8_CHEQI